jgi:hypothetical protein
MLAAYRELKNGEVDTLELDVHLEGCASCRQELARYMLIGEQVRSLPVIEPLPDMHVTLMHALAKVQLGFIRRSAPGTVITPEFLKPYIQEHVQSSHDSDLITAFSTAETGPLPIIQAKRKPRHRSHMSQFAVLGLAAMFLIVLMMGGLTSLLMLAHNNLQPNSITVRAEHIEVIPAQYTTSTPYPHVVSAVADGANIYYTAYGDGTNNSWMLEMLNRKTKISTPLLPTPNANTLIVLGSSTSGVVWLQFDGYKSNPHQKDLPGYSQHPPASLQWSLHYLSSEQLQQIVSGLYTPSEVLLTGTFNQNSAPSWITTPIQGIWFINESHQASLLVASIDSNGISHLTSYQLATVGTPVATEIATATAGHILTSPTATSDGTQIYWSEEWFSNAGVLSSDIWTQQVVDAVGPSHGRWAGHLQKMIVKERFTSDGISFRPQVVDNTLLTLCTASQVVCTASQANTTQGTPTTMGTGTATSSPTPSPNTSVIPRTVANIYAPPLDASVSGTILMLPLTGNPLERRAALNTTGMASSLQAGADFALWQGDNGYEMYDVSQGSDVTVGNTLDNAAFVAVNGASVVWMVNSNTSNTTGKTGPSVTLMAFNWPK